MYLFLPEASFGLRVLSLPASVCVCLSVCLSVCQSRVCPRDNSSPVQPRITKIGPEVRKTLVKIPIVLGVDWPWPSRSNIISKSKFTQFWASPWDNSSSVRARTIKFGPEVQNTLVKISIVHCAWHVKFNLFSKSCLFASLLRLWNIGETCINIWKTESVPHTFGCAQICSLTASCHWPWNSRVVPLVWPLLASQSSTRRLTMDF